MGNPDLDSIWLYSPNFPLAIVGAILYSIPTVIQFYQTVLKYRSYYFIPVLIGACLEVGGYIARAVSIKQQTEIVSNLTPPPTKLIKEQPPYAVSSSLIILAPLFIGAGNYLLLSHLCLGVLPSSKTHIFHIQTAHLTRIFVTCDILTFLIQASGSGIASSGNWKGNTVKIGTDVLIVGLAVQVATFALFMGIVGKFHALTGSEVREEAGGGWRKVLMAVYISSGLIIVSLLRDREAFADWLL
jgi:hypothetical protein